MEARRRRREVRRVEIRLSDDSVEISGYVNAVGRESHPLRDSDGYFVETVEPGAFARALAANPDVPVLLNHDPATRIAEGEDRELREDAVGLYIRAIIRNSDVVAKAAANKIRGWSFGFDVIRESSGERDGLRHRTLQDIRLIEVSLLDDTKVPAYPATSVYTRDADGSQVEVRFLADECQVHDMRSAEPPSLKEWTDRIDALGTIE